MSCLTSLSDSYMRWPGWAFVNSKTVFMENWIIGLIIGVGFSLISTMLNYKATKKLDRDNETKLIDLFYGTGFYNTCIWILLTILFFIGVRFQVYSKLTVYAIYIVLFIGFISITNYISFRKLQRNSFSDSFIKSYLLSKSLRLLGILFFLTISYY